MSDIERLTVTLTAEMARQVREAVEAGDYASSSEVVREALRDWRYRRSTRESELQKLRADVQAGMEDIAAGRVRAFDPERIIKKGKQKSAAGRSSSR